MQPKQAYKDPRLNYHLKKTQPLKTRVKRTVAEQLKAYQRTEKVSTFPRKAIISNLRYIDEPINQQHGSENINSVASRTSICTKNGRKNIFERVGSQNKVKKLNVAQRGKSLKYWKVQAAEEEPKILTQVKSFFNGLLSSSDGCKCGIECPWAAEFMKWVEVGPEVYVRHYKNLLRKLENKSHETEFSNDSDQETEADRKIREKTLTQIKKDITRTQSQSSVFQDAEVQAKGEKILMCYSIEDPEVGYVQGMNMIMSGILYHVREEAQTYAVVRKLFHQIRAIYLKNFEECYRQVDRIIKLIQSNIYDLHEHFNELGVELRLIIFPWVLSLLTVLVPLEYIHLVYLGFMKQKWKFIDRVILAVFLYHKKELKEMEEHEDVLVFLSVSNEGKKEKEWDQILKFASQLNFFPH